MRGGGSIKGLVEIFSEVDISIVGIGVAIVNIEPEKKKVRELFPDSLIWEKLMKPRNPSKSYQIVRFFKIYLFAKLFCCIILTSLMKHCGTKGGTTNEYY